MSENASFGEMLTAFHSLGFEPTVNYQTELDNSGAGALKLSGSDERVKALASPGTGREIFYIGENGTAELYRGFNNYVHFKTVEELKEGIESRGIEPRERDTREYVPIDV